MGKNIPTAGRAYSSIQKFMTCQLVEMDLVCLFALQIHKIETTLEYTIVDLKPPILYNCQIPKYLLRQVPIVLSGFCDLKSGQIFLNTRTFTLHTHINSKCHLKLI